MYYWEMIYNTFFWAFGIVLTLFNNTWIQMRVNLGLVFFLLWLGLCLLGLVLFRHRRQVPGLLFSAVNLAVCSGYCLLSYGLKRLLVVPAALIREGLGLPVLPFATINYVLAGFILIGFLFILYAGIKRKR